MKQVNEECLEAAVLEQCDKDRANGSVAPFAGLHKGTLQPQEKTEMQSEVRFEGFSVI